MSRAAENEKKGGITRNRVRVVLAVIFGVFALVVAAGVTIGFKTRQEVVLSGKTMGTTYHIKAVVTGKMSADHLQRLVDERLAAINRSMSIFDPESEISAFNRASTGETVAISAGFEEVMREGRRIFDLTQGAWDATVGPLVDLWGFGLKKKPDVYPDATAIETALFRVGFSEIVLEDGTLTKKRDGISLDLGSIAKGYGVDALAQLLSRKGIENYLVEVGGEVYAHGHRMDGKPWRVGISSPERGAISGELFQVRTLSGQALATSGDYRNYVEMNGRIWTHVIDPRNGRPVENGVSSASVEADSTLFADGLATALMVMGAEKGLALVNELPGVECLLIVRSPGGGLTVHASKGWVSSSQ